MLSKINKKIKIENTKKYNIGLGFLKVILALSVIISHNLDANIINNIIIKFFAKRRRIHVPSFFIMSFYFIYKDLNNLNINKIKQRFERLLIPYIIWPIIIWILNNLLNLFYFNFLPMTINDLLSQLFWGHNFIIQFWFQWDLIMITLIVVIITFLFKANNLFILILIAILAYALQYSEINKEIYIHLDYYKRESICRLAEMFPYSVTGLYLANFEIINKLNKNKVKSFLLSLIVFFFIEKYKIFISINGIAYSGMKLNIHSISLIFFFSIISSDKISNNKSLRIITNYTAGIFYLHWSVIKFFKNFVKHIENGTFIGCILIYLICYIICFFGFKISKRTRFKYLFC